jgi:hypothetical protein
MANETSPRLRRRGTPTHVGYLRLEPQVRHTKRAGKRRIAERIRHVPAARNAQEKDPRTAREPAPPPSGRGSLAGTEVARILSAQPCNAPPGTPSFTRETSARSPPQAANRFARSHGMFSTPPGFSQWKAAADRQPSSRNRRPLRLDFPLWEEGTRFRTRPSAEARTPALGRTQLVNLTSLVSFAILCTLHWQARSTLAVRVPCLAFS